MIIHTELQYFNALYEFHRGMIRERPKTPKHLSAEEAKPIIKSINRYAIEKAQFFNNYRYNKGI